VIVGSGKNTETVHLFFPRHTPQGRPLIDGHESAVTFVYAVGGFRLKAKFDPREMGCPDGTTP
jgi:hypothetical protein